MSTANCQIIKTGCSCLSVEVITQAKLAVGLQLMEINLDRSAIAKIELGLRPISDIEWGDSNDIEGSDSLAI